MAIADPVQLAVHVCGILNRLGIRSVVGGSIASSILLGHAYLRSAAERADVTRLLDRALAEAGLR